MKQKLIIVAIVVLIISIMCCAVGCEQASRVRYNLTMDADNFNLIRKVTVINCIEGDVLFQMEGRMSITADTTDNQLEIMVQNGEKSFSKHIIGLSDNVTYVLEQIGEAEVNNYRYTLYFNPKMWLPIEIENVEKKEA